MTIKAVFWSIVRGASLILAISALAELNSAVWSDDATGSQPGSTMTPSLDSTRNLSE